MTDKNLTRQFRFTDLIGPHHNRLDATIYYLVVCEAPDDPEICLMINLLFNGRMELIKHRVDIWSESFESVKKWSQLPSSRSFSLDIWQHAQYAIAWFNRISGADIAIFADINVDAD